MTTEAPEMQDIEEMMKEPGVTSVALKDVEIPLSDTQKKEIIDFVAEFGRQYREQSHKEEKLKLALVVGRFQPPHLGHLVKLLMAAEIAEVVAVGLGSANADIHADIGSTRDVENPFSAADREYLLKQLLNNFFTEDQIRDRFRFVPLDDEYYHYEDKSVSDAVWGENTKTKVLNSVKDLNIQKIDGVLADKQLWVSEVFVKQGIDIIPHPLYMPDTEVGSLKREALRQPRKGFFGRVKKPILSESGPHVLIRKRGFMSRKRRV